jgi:hypothetical protein
MSTPETPPPDGGGDAGRGLSGVQRAGIVLGGIAVLLIVFAVLRSGGSDNSSSTSSSAAQSTTTTAATGATSTSTATGTTDDNGGGGSGSGDDSGGGGGGGGGDDSGGGGGGGGGGTVATITVVNGQPQGGVKTVSFKKGDTVRLKVVSDVADEIHVHGYDLKKDVAKGGEVEFEFPASIEGRFEVELENAGTQIANLEVTP